MAKAKWPITRIVELTWFDASSRSGWEHVDSYLDHEPVPVVSVGYVLKDNKNEVVLIQNQITSQTDCSGAIAVPRTWIVKMKVLRK